jgi:hypothetical protein
MLAAFGVDVRDPATTPRRVLALAERLPPHARRMGQAWSTESELLAVLADAIGVLTWVTVRAAGGRAARPRPLPRPKIVSPGAGPARREPARGGWMAAAGQLALMPGVEVSTDGGRL